MGLTKTLKSEEKMDSTIQNNGAGNAEGAPELINSKQGNSIFNRILIIFVINILALIVLSASVSGLIYARNVQKHDKQVKLEIIHSKFMSKVNEIKDQKITISIAGKDYVLNQADISSMLDNSKFSSNMLKVNQSSIFSYLTNLGNKAYVKPIEEIKLSHDDGSGIVLSKGTDGTQVDSSSFNQAAKNIEAALLNGESTTVKLNTTTLPFSISTSPTQYDKLIEANITTKRMYAYQNGELIKTFLIDAGAPITPTPIGTFKVLYKVPIMNMTGENLNGTTYFQPNVQWVLFFDTSGHSIHGNYWRPLSAFGNLNTSHGCIGVVNSDAEWIYDWAPKGTTIITHY